MFNQEERKLFVDLLAQIAEDWEETYTSEALRLDYNKIDLLMRVQEMAAQPGSDVNFELLRSRAPGFCSVFRSVILREIEELTTHGSANAGGH